jgi:heme-degrading monooxygenase HmoA
MSPAATPRYLVSFQWEAGEYDAEFHRLNAAIDAVAKAMPEFLGVESWRSPDGRRGNAVYYWRSLEALQAFGTHPDHLEAKRQYARWYTGYRVVVAEVLREYGDGRLQAPA